MRRKETDHGLQLERNTLRFLCSVLIKSGTRVEICKLLDPRVFEDPLQRVVFEEIRELGSIDSRRLRELLPARVANRGFRLEGTACPTRSERKRDRSTF